MPSGIIESKQKLIIHNVLMGLKLVISLKGVKEISSKGLVSLFKDQSTFMGYLMIKLSL